MYLPLQINRQIKTYFLEEKVAPKYISRLINRGKNSSETLLYLSDLSLLFLMNTWEFYILRQKRNEESEIINSL